MRQYQLDSSPAYRFPPDTTRSGAAGPGSLTGSPSTGNPSAIFSTAALAVSSFARTYRMNVCAECPMIFAPVFASPPINGANAVANECLKQCGVKYNGSPV
jgi:hypothetical protein